MNILYIGVAVVVVLSGTWLFISSDEQDPQELVGNGISEVATVPQAVAVRVSPELAPEPDQPTVVTPPNTSAAGAPTPPSGIEKAPATAGELKSYNTASDLANLTGTNILFFKASWCITCKQLYDALVSEQSQIPADVTIWVVDYDSNQDMRRKYGVTSQHTLVQIDTSGNKVSLWRGGFSLAEVLGNIQ